MKKFLIIVTLIFLLCGCRSSSSFDLQKIMQENEYIIIDVRTKEEYNESHVIGAINIPYDELATSSLSKEKIIFVYCRSGTRSKIAYNTLTTLGYTVYDLGSFANIDLPKE